MSGFGRHFGLAVCLIVGLGAWVRGDEVDEAVREEMQRQHIPGVSIAVVRGGRVIKSAGYGYANLELNVAATPETVYKIGSISKQFLAAAIMLLVEDGKLTLDDHIANYLDDEPESWKPMTVRQVLSHTAGLPREGPGFAPFRMQRDADVIRSAYRVALVGKPGERYEYSNLGYFVVAEIIRKAAGRPWEEFLRDRILEPAGLTNTRVTSYREIVANRASSYQIDAGHLGNADHNLSVRPSGALLSTVLDLAKWDAVLYTDRILNERQKEAMWTPERLSNGTLAPYGLGWQIDRAGNHRCLEHSGMINGFKSQFSRFVDDKLTIIVLTNLREANPADIVRVIAPAYLSDLKPAAATEALKTLVHN